MESFNEGESLLDLAMRNKWEVPFSCGGYGTCGTCRVFVNTKSSGLSERNEIENEFAEMRGFQPHERLACQIELTEKLNLIFATKPEL